MNDKCFLTIVTAALVAGCAEKSPSLIPSNRVLSDGLSQDSEEADDKGKLATVEQYPGDTVELVLETFQNDCVPSCEGKECGDDGCGGSCGECGMGKVCSNAGRCVSYCDWLCESLDRECGPTGPPDNCYCGECADDNLCTDDFCDEQGHCRYENNSEPCDDGNPCTVNDMCSDGICVGDPLVCNDDNPCTDDGCLDGKCVWSSNDDALCDDGDPCTEGDKCFKGVCQPGSPLDCNDNVPCTMDSCIEGVGCVNIPTDSLCDDDNVCTDEHCDVTKGCVTSFNALPCDDGNPCTVGDFCQDGKCLPGKALLSCDDWNMCTKDSCDPTKGCIHEPVEGEPCDDKNACTTKDTCIAGVCTGGPLVECNDGNPCTEDGCEPEAGCWHTPVVDNTPCGNDMSCHGGMCQYYCGDGLCAEAQEDHCNCSEDCPGPTCSGCCAGTVCKPGTLSSECGKNGAACETCLGGKTCQNQACVYKCGDGVCAPKGDETCVTCPADCGECCGNGLCDTGEGGDTCPADCGGKITPGFVKIGKGSFWMGSPEGCPGPAGYPGSCEKELGRESDEKLHYVQLTHNFEMQVHEVTQGEWKEAFAGWNPSFYLWCGETCPVERISWYDACAYANWKSEQAKLPPCYVFSDVKCRYGPNVGSNYKKCLNSTDGGISSATVVLAGGVSKPYECKGFRLPTEAEWEYAARAGSLTAFYPSEGNDGKITDTECSDPNLDQIAWYCGNAEWKTHPVGEKEANAWGLKDMSGNVWEWCWDGYDTYPDGTQGSPDVDPAGGGDDHRLMRGGCRTNFAKDCRSARRYALSPDYRAACTGFRLVRTLAP